MLEKLINSPHVASLLKILFKKQLSVILDYPSYQILAVSDGILPGLDIVGKIPEEIDNPIACISPSLRKEQLKFRIEGISSTWLVFLKLQTSASISLYKVIDTPIFHENKLVGMFITFNDLTMDNLRLINWVFNDASQKNISNGKINFQELSDLEREVLFLAALGKSAKQISNIMASFGVRNIGYNTINSIISQRIYKKLEVQNISDAILSGVESKQVSTIPESLSSKLKQYYLIGTEKDCILL